MSCFFNDSASDVSYCRNCNMTVFYNSAGRQIASTCAFTSTECVSASPSSHRKIASYWAFADDTDDTVGHVRVRCHS